MPASLPTARRDALVRQFSELYGAPPVSITRSPGRVNLIGEHTDYNEGFVLPVAIDRSAYVAAAPRSDRTLRVYNAQRDEAAELSLDSLRPGVVRGWAAYVAGMADFLQRAGHRLSGADLLVDGDVPQGAGLSSSASFEVATGATLLSLSGLPIDKLGLAQAGQRTEHEYINAMTGIMDQMISALGQAEHALLIDCRDYSTQAIPLRGDVQIVVCDSKVQRELAQSGYNQRRAECDQAVTIIQQQRPDVRTLRDVTRADLERWGELLPPNVLKRARHVVGENTRVLDSAAALRQGDLARFGELMNEAHRSYRDDFEASLPPIEVLVSAAQQVPGVYGSRLTGGGWGGCTVTLLRSGAVEQFREQVAGAYRDAVGYEPEIYVCTASEGVEVSHEYS